MKLSLRAKVLLISVGILFGTLAATSLVSGIIFSTEHAAALRAGAFATGHNLKRQLDGLLKLQIPLEDLVGFDEQCREIVEGHPDISFAGLIDPEGKIIFHSDPSQHGYMIDDPRLIQDIRSGLESSGTYAIGGKKSFGIVIPVKTDGLKPVAGAIYIGFPPQLISTKTQRMIGYSAAVAVLFFAIGIALLMLMVNLWVTQPLKKLVEVIDDIQETGVHSMQVVEIRSNDEMGQLAAAFNRMIHSLKASRRKIEEYADQLEVKVSRRTREIVQANEKLRLELADRRRIEGELKNRERFLQNVFDAIQGGICVLDRNLTIVRVNAYLEKIFATRGRLEGMKCYQAFHGRETLCPQCLVDLALKTGKAQTGIFRSPNREEPGWVDISAYPFVDQDGNVTGVIEYVKDITAKRRNEEERLRLGAAVEQAGEAVIITGADGSILHVNSAFERITGLNRIEAEAGDHSLQIFVDDENTYRAILDTVSRGEVWSGQVLTRTENRRDLHVHLSVSPIRNDSGGINNFVAVARDVTNEVMIEKQLRQAQKMESIGTLAGGIAHDFNNLLSIIMGNLDLAAMDLENHPAGAYLEQIKIASRRATELVSQILVFSRKQVNQPQVINLNDLVQNTRKMLGRLIGENIDLVTNLASNLRTVKIDPGQMEQVILNLSVNARDAMAEGGRISIETANVDLEEGCYLKHFDVQPGSYVMLTVNDTGSGMDEETQTHIFEPFFTTKEKGKGTGLGLATVYGIVKQNNGYIYVYSEPALGTTFKIYLPSCEESVVRRPGEGEGPAEPSGGCETILVVEDEKMLRTVTSRILTQQGYRVLEAKNGEDALQVSATFEGPIHLVFTDVVMPGMNVREMADRLREMRREAKMVYVSGYAEEAIAHYGVLEDGTEFLRKPFTPSQVISKVRRVLDG